MLYKNRITLHYFLAIKSDLFQVIYLNQLQAFYYLQDMILMLSNAEILLTMAHIFYCILFQDENSLLQLN